MLVCVCMNVSVSVHKKYICLYTILLCPEFVVVITTVIIAQKIVQIVIYITQIFFVWGCREAIMSEPY